MLWWIQLFFVLSAVFVIASMGWFNLLWIIDVSKISFFILFLFTCTTITTGFLSKSQDGEKIERVGNFVWFASNAMVAMGMIGTVVGFMLMLSVLNGPIIDVTAIIPQMATGMGAALTTTLSGLICSLLTKFQMQIAETPWS